MLNYELTRAWQSPDVRHAFTNRDTILYALGIGIGADPLDERQLHFVYEKTLAVFPTMACVMASPGFWMRDRKELGIDAMKLVHGEQSVKLHAPLPTQGVVIGRSRVTRIVDKGEGKGAVIHVEKQLFDEGGLNLLATVEQVLFARGDGGFSKMHGKSDESAPVLAAAPDRTPDRSVDVAVRLDAALLYRLSGDINPLHVDPSIASKAGFPKPILHGLATYGMAAKALIAEWADYNASHLKSIRARLSAPVYPGETIRLESWRIDGGVAFRARVIERDVMVLTQGTALLQHGEVT